MTDVQLLDRFVGENDEAAFDAIVARHGPRVSRVCREVLSNPHDVDDAFQGTFLVLLRKASLIRDPQALGNWLHGVAHRVATRHRRDAARRRGYERDRGEPGPSLSEDSRPWDDMGRTVREELSHLPESYRVPLELCYLRGRTHEQAATELGWPLGTLKTRINRGRKRLQDRLDRRGITVGVGLLLLLLSRGEAEAAPWDAPGGPDGPGDPAGPPRTPAFATVPRPRPARWAPKSWAPPARPRLLGIVLIFLALMLAATQVLAFFTPDEPGCG